MSSLFLRLRIQRVGCTGLLALLAGCASLPPDGGLGEVGALTAAHGMPLPATTDRQATLDRLLAPPLSLRDAIDIALLANPRFNESTAQLGFAGAEVLAAGRLANPVLSGALGFPSAADAVQRFSFGIAADFVSLLTLPARRRYAEADFARVQQLVASQVLELAAATGRAYYMAAATERAAEFSAATAEITGASLELAQRMQEAGNLAPLALSERQIAAAQAELQRLSADTAAASAHEALGLAMGVPASRSWSLATLPELPAADPLTAGLAARADQDRLDLRAARSRVAALQDRLGTTRATRWLGDAELGVQHERDSDGRRTTGPSLALGLPLDGGRSGVLNASSEVQQAQAEADELQLAVGHEVVDAIQQLAAARKRVELLGNSLLPAYEAAVLQNQQQFNFMLSGPYELLYARQQQTQAQTQYLDALRDYWLARVALARAVGGSATDAAPSTPISGAR